VDRPACWLGMPVTAALEQLFEYFKVPNLRELKLKIDTDIWEIDVPYNHPPNNHIAMAFNFPKGGQSYEKRTLTAPGFFENYKDPLKDDVDDFDWPDPSNHIDPDECRKVVEAVPEDFAVMGVLWSAHFQDVYSAFGMEKAFINMQKRPEIFIQVHDRIIDFYLKANKIFYEATKGKVDAVLIGNDFGGQKRLMLSPQLIREFAMPGAKKLVDQAKKYGLKVIYHSCGSIFEVIPEIIKLGVDAIHPIQALATDMEPFKLNQHFGNQISFCGGVDAQELLVFGTPDEIKEKVVKLKNIFPTGLIISPSHEAILPDIPPQNVDALFQAARIED
jgi:uroporphyrinogen decarboxylase